MSDIDVVIPAPKLWLIGGEELRQAPLSIRRLLAVVRYVEKNLDLAPRLKDLGKPKEEGGLSFSEMLQGDLYKRVNELMRLLLPGYEAKLTDDWCEEYMTNAYYWGILQTALKQNQLESVFTKAKGFLSTFLDERLRRTASAAEAKTEVSA